jgi:hypothetical protein
MHTDIKQTRRAHIYTSFHSSVYKMLCPWKPFDLRKILAGLHTKNENGKYEKE